MGRGKGNIFLYRHFPVANSSMKNNISFFGVCVGGRGAARGSRVGRGEKDAL